MNPNIYWIANYLWDILIFLFPTALSIAIFAMFQSNAYTGKDNIGCLVLLFILFGMAATPLMYPATYLFEKESVLKILGTFLVTFYHFYIQCDRPVSKTAIFHSLNKH